MYIKKTLKNIIILIENLFNLFMEENDFWFIRHVNNFFKYLENLSSFAGNFAFVIIFIIFLIFEENHLKKKIELCLSSSNIKILNKINYDFFFYFQLKTITSLLTGIFTFIILFF